MTSHSPGFVQPPQVEAWDGDKELRKLIGDNDELRAIYGTLGYSVYVDQESQRILSQLRCLVEYGEVKEQDQDQVKTLLAKLEKLFTNAPSPMNAGHRESFFVAVKMMRLNRFGSLSCLEIAIKNWLGQEYSDDDPAYIRKAQLDDLLATSLWVRFMSGQDDSQWHKDAAKQAQTYVDSTWMHTPWLTTRFLTDLFDVELAPLSREAKCPQENVSLRTLMPFTSWLLPQPWATFVPGILSFFFLAGSAAGIYLLFSFKLRWAGWLWIAYLCWHYYWRFNRGHIVAKAQGRLTRLAKLLRQVRDEVDSGSYDAQEIALRLRRYEVEGLYVHSLAYALLRLSTTASAIGPEST